LEIKIDHWFSLLFTRYCSVSSGTRNR